jgi:hypothetical protein
MCQQNVHRDSQCKIYTNKSVDTGKQTFDTLLSVKITYSKKNRHLIIDSGVGLPISLDLL